MLLLTAMKIPYCTCDNQSKEVFHNGFLFIGLFVNIVLAIAITYLVVLENDYLLAFLPALLWVLVLYYRLEYKRQALHLGHSPACARRYANVAALATVRGYDPEYSKLKGYKSSYWELAERRLGKRKAKKFIHGLAVLGLSVLFGGIILMSYIDLTSVRNGTFVEYARYSPIVTEAFLLAMGLGVLSLLVYAHFDKNNRHRKRLAGIIAVGYFMMWTVIIYFLSLYARVDFKTKLIESIFVIAAPIGIVVLLSKLSDKWYERKRKKRRRKSKV